MQYKRLIDTVFSSVSVVLYGSTVTVFIYNQSFFSVYHLFCFYLLIQPRQGKCHQNGII